MASTYTTDINIELIGTGEQAGSWGATTNENWQRVDEAVTAYAAVPIDKDDAEYTWTLSNDTYAFTDAVVGTDSPGSSGRAAFVEFINSGGGTNVDCAITIEGNSGASPRRMFYARNSLTGGDITFDVGGNEAAEKFILKNGATALVYTKLAGTTVENEVHNGLGTVQLSGISLEKDGVVVFEGSTDDAYETTLTVVNPTADRTVQLPNEGTILVGKDTTDTLTNKTLTFPIITSISNSGTVTIPSGTDTLVTKTSTDILSNKTLNLPKINDSELDHQYIFAVSNLVSNRTVTLPLLGGNDEFAFLDHEQTLQNKTLVAPTISSVVINGSITGNLLTAVSGNSPSKLSSAAEIKTYVDSIASVGFAQPFTINTADSYSVSDGQNNILIGTDAGAAINSAAADDNTVIGAGAGSSLTSGKFNTFVGRSAGNNLANGHSCIAIGRNCTLSNTGVSNQIVIGIGIAAAGNGLIRIGTASGHIQNDFEANATWAWTSDERIKKNISDLSVGLDFVNALRPVSFEYRQRDDLDGSENDAIRDAIGPIDEEGNELGGRRPGTSIGFVAQEVKSAIDSYGIDSISGDWGVGEDGIQTVGQTAFIPSMVKAIQELSSTVDTLNARIVELEGNAN